MAALVPLSFPWSPGCTCAALCTVNARLAPRRRSDTACMGRVRVRAGGGRGVRHTPATKKNS